MLPAMSAEQDDKTCVKSMMRNSIMLSAYIIFPVMAGLAAVATPLVSVLLTDKWLPCVPYMQVYCFSLAFYPVHSCNLQAINAMGRSDIFLKLEIIKKSYGLVLLTIAVFCFDSPLAIASTGLITTIISCFVNSHPNKKLIDYSYFEQMKDLLPSMIMAVVMCVTVLIVGTLNFSSIVILFIQIITGVAVYVTLSLIIKPMPYRMSVEIIKKILNNKDRERAARRS